MPRKKSNQPAKTAPATPTQIPNQIDVDQLHETLAQLQISIQVRDQAIQLKDFEIAKLKHELLMLRRAKFGSKADKLDPDIQRELFGQDAAESAQQDPEENSAPADDEFGYRQDSERKKVRKNRVFPPELPRVEKRLELPEEERLCPCCGKPKVEISQERTERVDYIPATIQVIVQIRPNYACPNKACDSTVTTAPEPMRPIEKSYAEPGLLAHILISKHADHLPLNRQEEILARQGIEISRKTMCDWMRGCADALEPLYKLIDERVFESFCIGVDETGVPVQVKGGPFVKTGRIWAIVGDQTAPYISYYYSPTRESFQVTEHFGSFTGYFQADACSVYDALYRISNIIEVGCWAHARRKFIDAQESDSIRAARAVLAIRLLYKIERETAELPPLERHQIRSRKSRRILRALFNWFEKQLLEVVPKSPIAGAISYCLRHRNALTRYLDDGRIPIDNNRTERALRSVVIGRKNWLFCGSDQGGRTAAILCSIIASAKLHHLDLFAYLRDVLTRISAHPNHRLEELLPDRWAALQPPQT